MPPRTYPVERRTWGRPRSRRGGNQTTSNNVARLMILKPTLPCPCSCRSHRAQQRQVGRAQVDEVVPFRVPVERLRDPVDGVQRHRETCTARTSKQAHVEPFLKGEGNEREKRGQGGGGTVEYQGWVRTQNSAKALECSGFRLNGPSTNINSKNLSVVQKHHTIFRERSGGGSRPPRALRLPTPSGRSR